MIESVAEGIAAVTKVFAGALSDYFRRRKTLIVLGYTLAALSRPLFPLASSASWIFGARFIDRMSKGIRDAPRDALVTDVTAQAQRGAAYGLRQTLDSIGAVLGPALAVLLMLAFSGRIRLAMWIAVIPAALAVLVVLFLLREPEHKATPTREPPGLVILFSSCARATSGFPPPIRRRSWCCLVASMPRVLIPPARRRIG